MIPSPTADLVANLANVESAAKRSLSQGTYLGRQAVLAATAPYPYRYTSRIVRAAKSVAVAPVADRPDVYVAQVKVGGSAKVFSGGGSVRDVMFGAEFGAKFGDVRLTVGRRSMTLTTAEARDRIARARAGTRIRARRGYLRQFPPRRKDGWLMTPALDRVADQMYRNTELNFDHAIDGR